MRILFLHDAFPAQFGHLALELNRRHGWDCHFLVEALSNCPTPSREMLDRLDVRELSTLGRSIASKGRSPGRRSTGGSSSSARPFTKASEPAPTSSPTSSSPTAAGGPRPP